MGRIGRASALDTVDTATAARFAPFGKDIVNRRNILHGLGLFALAGVTRAAAKGDTLAAAWPIWKARFLRPEGNVVDPEQAGITHSEGQAYALLLAQAVGDRDAFDRIEGWTRAHLLVRNDALMAWRWTPGRGIVDTDWHNATDGDLFRAWALLRAARDSGWDVPRDRYADIVGDLSSSCLWPDPRAASELILRPGAEAFVGPGRVLFNPSYVMPRALRELAEATGDMRLMRAADHGETCLAELARRGTLPDWIDITADGYADPTDHALRSAYDALRIPLYLAWSNRRDHPAVPVALGRMAPRGTPPKVTVARNAEGTKVNDSDLPGYVALARFVACEKHDPAVSGVADGPYYPAVLHMLTDLAQHESESCAPSK